MKNYSGLPTPYFSSLSIIARKYTFIRQLYSFLFYRYTNVLVFSFNLRFSFRGKICINYPGFALFCEPLHGMAFGWGAGVLQYIWLMHCSLGVSLVLQLLILGISWEPLVRWFLHAFSELWCSLIRRSSASSQGQEDAVYLYCPYCSSALLEAVDTW